MIIIRAIKPAKPFQSSVFREEMIKAANEIRVDALAAFKKTTVTWKHQPKFSSKILTGASAGGVQIQIGTDDAIYGYIDKGTKVRYATMSKDWKSKTEPNVVSSEPGKGKMLFVNKKRPRPGIKARKFTKHIAATTKTELARVAKNALARAARRCGHGTR